MTRQIRAVYENGVLRPTRPLALEEGAEVDVVVMERTPDGGPAALARVLAEIAAMPMEADDEGFSGADHDVVLYGKRKQP